MALGLLRPRPSGESIFSIQMELEINERASEMIEIPSTLAHLGLKRELDPTEVAHLDAI